MTHGLNLQIAAEAGTTGPKWLDAFLPSNVSIDITLNSQIWNAKAGSFSETIALPIEENLHILGNLASMRGCDVYKLLYGRRFRLYAEGVLFFYGVIHLDQEVSIKDNTIEIELASSTLEWEDLIADLDCRDVPLKDRIVLGDAIDTEQEIVLTIDYSTRYLDKEGGSYGDWKRKSGTANERLIFPKILFPSVVNISTPYPAAKFCNINICWQKEDSEGNKLREYEIGGYSRTSTSPCFYVLYFLDCLFKHLGIILLRNDLTAVDDLCRLAFVNTSCSFDVDKKEGAIRVVNVSDYISMKAEQSKYFEDIVTEIKDVDIRLSDSTFKTYKAIANSRNFPDKDVQTVVSSILDGFGARLIYDSVAQTAKIVLLRNILTQENVEEIPCQIISAHHQQFHKKGFRLKYNETKADKEEDLEDYGRDTMYNYTDYRDVIHVIYDNIYKSPRIYDNRCYIDDRTGNAYRVKVDKDAKDARTLYPSWFQVAQFCKAEYGDCSNDDFVTEVTIGFSPVVMNTVSSEGKYERYAYFVDIENIGKEIVAEQALTCSYIWMGPQISPVYSDYDWSLNVSVTYKGDAAYNTSKSGNNPLDEYDNGLTLGFCRGVIPSVAPADDGEGNQVVDTKAQYDNVFHEDSVDAFGNVFDYNGTDEEIGGDPSDRISLHLRAEKPDVNYVDPEPDPEITPEEAKQTILDTFTVLHADVFHRQGTSKAALRAAGWDVEGDETVYMYCLIYECKLSYLGEKTKILVTPIKEDGTILHPNDILRYTMYRWRVEEGVNRQNFISDIDEVDPEHIVLDFDASESRKELLENLLVSYYAEVDSSEPIFIPDDSSSHKTKHYFQITEPLNRNRGLFNRFYSEYSKWDVDCSVAVVEAETELAWLMNIDMTKKYKIGGYVGFLKSVKYSISNSGLSKVIFEIFYL